MAAAALPGVDVWLIISTTSSNGYTSQKPYCNRARSLGMRCRELLVSPMMTRMTSPATPLNDG
jgi:hypothetical protein